MASTTAKRDGSFSKKREFAKDATRTSLKVLRLAYSKLKFVLSTGLTTISILRSVSRMCPSAAQNPMWCATRQREEDGKPDKLAAKFSSLRMMVAVSKQAKARNFDQTYE
mmetsp:Transcript_63262/g.110423  ORF Transcript_63262/g.110423 Transcript_63262/m.110423 type:complete len:110 (-) Transcript_63262:154-483(-)